MFSISYFDTILKLFYAFSKLLRDVNKTKHEYFFSIFNLKIIHVVNAHQKKYFAQKSD